MQPPQQISIGNRLLASLSSEDFATLRRGCSACPPSRRPHGDLSENIQCDSRMRPHQTVLSMGLRKVYPVPIACRTNPGTSG